MTPPISVLRPDLPERLKRTFTDAAYLARVVIFLKHSRREQGLTVNEVAWRAGVEDSVIRRAEHGEATPKTREFKAWSAALGHEWDQVWSESCTKPLPGKRRA